MRPRKGLRLVVCLVSLALALCSCSVRYERPEIRPADAVFPGIRDGLDASSRADVLFLHGMCHHTREDWAVPVNAIIASALGLTARVESEGVAIGSFGARLFPGRLAGERWHVDTYSIVWSPISAGPKKETLCQDVVDGNPNCEGSGTAHTGVRALINRKIKDGLVNDCFSDAILYSGARGRAAIVEAVQAGLLYALSGGRASACRSPSPQEASDLTRRPLIILTESLGSKILIDALEAGNAACPAADLGQWLARPVQVFMAANQLPLLSLAATTSPGPLAAAARSVPAEIQGLRRLLRRSRPLGPAARLDVSSRHVVVAFSDPSDLLSYPLRPFASGIDDIEFIDVLVSNGPEYAGLFADPVAAHRGYRENRRVLQLIACGSRGRDGDCPEPKRP